MDLGPKEVTTDRRVTYISFQDKSCLYWQPDIARQLTLKHQGHINARSLLIVVKLPCHFIMQETPDIATDEKKCFKRSLLKKKKMLIEYKLSFPIFSASFCTKQISAIVHSCTYIKESSLIAALLQGSHMQVFQLSVLQQKTNKKKNPRIILRKVQIGF